MSEIIYIITGNCFCSEQETRRLGPRKKSGKYRGRRRIIQHMGFRKSALSNLSKQKQYYGSPGASGRKQLANAIARNHLEHMKRGTARKKPSKNSSAVPTCD